MSESNCPHCGAERNKDNTNYFDCGTADLVNAPWVRNHYRNPACYEREIAALQEQLAKAQAKSEERKKVLANIQLDEDGDCIWCGKSKCRPDCSWARAMED